MSKKIGTGLALQFLIVTIFLLGFLLIVATFSTNIDWPDDVSLIDSYIYQNRFFVDFLQFSAIVILLLSGNLFFRILGFTFALIFTFFYFTQSQSYNITGKYLPSIALENADHISFIDLDKIIFSGLIWLILFGLVCRLSLPYLKKVSYRSAIFMSMILLILSILIKNDKDWLSEETVANRFAFYNSGLPGVERLSPLGKLFETLGEYSAYLKKQNFISDYSAVLPDRSVEFIYESYPSFGAVDPEYKLVRDIQLDEEIEFLHLTNSPEQQNSPAKNVILFFIEGMSARLVETYYDNFPGLTPNIKAFSEKVIKVNSYYNHTFATYRGIGGQLCSFFPIGRLKIEVSYRCLNHILEANGYQSRFMVSQNLSNTDLDRIAYKTGFDEVDGSSELIDFLTLTGYDKDETVPDRVLIDGLIERLKELDKSGNKEPTFISFYNAETHTGRSLMEKGTVYHGTNDAPIEPNRVLDTFHNFDKEFGRFWEYFKNSDLYENTIVVVTSDHTTYPSKEFSEIMDGIEGYATVFVDEIPLLIYHPDLLETVEIDAEQSNSLDLAPSLLHLLGYDNFRAPFLGKSLFSAGPSPYAKTAGTPSRLWFKGKHDIWNRVSNSIRDETFVRYPEEVGKYEFIQYVEDLEQSNRIWPTDGRYD